MQILTGHFACCLCDLLEEMNTPGNRYCAVRASGWSACIETASSFSSPVQEQQHKGPDPVCCRGHRPEPAAVPARERAERGAGERRPRRVLREAVPSLQIPPGPAQGPGTRHQNQRLPASSPQSLLKLCAAVVGAGWVCVLIWIFSADKSCSASDTLISSLLLWCDL